MDRRAFLRGGAMNDKRRWLARIVAAAMLCALAWWVSRPVGSAYKSFDGEAFATHYRITYQGGAGVDKVLQAAEAELKRIDAMASTWREDSELMRYNRAVSPEAFDLSIELAGLIEHARQVEAQTGGAFSLRPDGGAIDLSGIAKGYAVDRVVNLLQTEFGVADGLVDIGGEVRAFGNGPKDDGWRVGLYLPADAAGVEVPVLQLRDTSVATSGAYFKGEHLIDPATGEPVVNELLSASVIHPSNATADALATALYVMGSERGMHWAEENGVRVIFLLKDGTRLEHTPE